jgi:hypothetical protein
MNRQQAALVLLDVHQRYAHKGVSLAQAALAGCSEFQRWNHCPKDDAKSFENATRFFYHAHSQEQMLKNEHGHFHVFTHDYQSSETKFSHLIGISLTDKGEPLRLFTTNQWVTGEFYRPVDAMKQALQRFSVKVSGRLAPVARWIEAMIHFYRDDVEQLLMKRDALLSNYPKGRDVAFEDQSMHITTELSLENYWHHLQKEIAS